MAITAVCERCGDEKEVTVDVYSGQNTFRISDLLKAGTQQLIEGKGMCSECVAKYNKLIEKQKKELADFVGEKRVKNAKQQTSQKNSG